MNKSLLITGFLLIGIFSSLPVDAKLPEGMKPNAPSAGALGAQGEAIRALGNVDVIKCKTTGCNPLKKEIESLNDQIETFETLLSERIKKQKSDTYKDLKASGKVKQFKSLKKNICKLSEEIKKTPRGAVSPNPKRVALIDQREQKIMEFIELVPAFDSEWDVVSVMFDKRAKLNDQLLKEVEVMKNINGNQDQPDVEPVEAGYLENGDLVAWGIPSIPHIPTPRPKTTTSSSSSAPAQQKEITDAGYKALRSVETESGKVTDTEKDQFISELNSRVGSN